MGFHTERPHAHQRGFRGEVRYAELNFGCGEIDWEANPSAQISLKAIGADGSTGFAHRIALNTLLNSE